MAEKQGIQVIARAAQILRALEGNTGGLSLSQLAVRVGLPRSTVQRIVNALVAEQMLISAGLRAGFMLGPALVRFAATANIETDRIARPVIQALSRELGETVDLSVLQGRSAIFVEQALGNSRLVAVSGVGEAFPLHCTANGKALLGCLSGERRRVLLSGKLQRHTPATLTTVVQIEKQVEAFMRTQLAVDMEEHTEGICAIGSSFIDPLGRNFAISVPVPASRFKAKRAAIGVQLLAARAEIIKRIPGCRLPA